MSGRHSPPVSRSSIGERLKRPIDEGPSGPSTGGLEPSTPGIASPSHLPALSSATGAPETLNTPATLLSLSHSLGNVNSPSADSVRRAQLTGGDGAVEDPAGFDLVVQGIDFHHASEAEFGRLLAYYGIEWQYEPRQFVLQWRDGRPVEMFRPDFYLPEYDLFIELTTMRQSLVRRKNRKLRLLRALYPEVNIKLIYRRDYQRLLERFGIRPEEVGEDIAQPAVAN